MHGRPQQIPLQMIHLMNSHTDLICISPSVISYPVIRQSRGAGRQIMDHPLLPYSRVIF